MTQRFPNDRKFPSRYDPVYNAPGMPPDNLGSQQLRGRPFAHQQRSASLISRIFEVTAGQSSVAVTNGNKFINAIGIELPKTDILILSKVYRTVWVDSVAGANWFPYGSAVDMTDYPVYSESGVYYFADVEVSPINLSTIDDGQDQSIFVLTNNEGNTHTFLIDGLVRYITNKGGEGEL